MYRNSNQETVWAVLPEKAPCSALVQQATINMEPFNSHGKKTWKGIKFYRSKQFSVLHLVNMVKLEDNINPMFLSLNGPTSSWTVQHQDDQDHVGKTKWNKVLTQDQVKLPNNENGVGLMLDLPGVGGHSIFVRIPFLGLMESTQMPAIQSKISTENNWITGLANVERKRIQQSLLHCLRLWRLDAGEELSRAKPRWTRHQKADPKRGMYDLEFLCPWLHLLVILPAFTHNLLISTWALSGSFYWANMLKKQEKLNTGHLRNSSMGQKLWGSLDALSLHKDI